MFGFEKDFLDFMRIIKHYILKKKREVIFSATIEFTDGQKHIGQNSYISEVSFEKLDYETREVLCKTLPSDLKKIYGVEVNIRHIESREGSLIVFFGAIVTIYGIIANYKKFVDSVHLIKIHAHWLLEQLMKKLNVTGVYTRIKDEYPNLLHYDNIEYDLLLRHLYYRFPPDIAEKIVEMGLYSKNSCSRRDGFFWYLFIMNIILFIVLCLLIGKAVLRVYF